MGTAELGLKPLLVSACGLLLDTSILIAAERQGQDPDELVDRISDRYGDPPLGLSFLSIAELAEGVYRTSVPQKRLLRERFLNLLLRTMPIHSATASTGHLIGRLRGQEALRGFMLPISDLVIGATALELSYGVLTLNERHFKLIPGLAVHSFWEETVQDKH